MDKSLKSYIVYNGIANFGSIYMNLTLYWLLYKVINNPILYIPVAAAEPVSRFAFSYIGGYIADKYNNRKMYLLFSSLNRVFVLLTTLFIILDNPLLAVISFLLRWTNAMLGAQVSQATTFRKISKEEIAKATYYLRLAKETLEISAIISWPFLLYHFQALTAIIGLVVSEAGVLGIARYMSNERSKKVISFKQGIKEYFSNKTIFFTYLPFSIVEGGLAMVYFFPAALIQILHGTAIEYTFAEILSSLSRLLGSWTATKITKSENLGLLSAIAYFFVFIALIPENPWLVGVSLFFLGFGDSLYSVIFYTALKTAKAELYGSILGIDEFITNAFRLPYEGIAGVLYNVAYLGVPILGIATTTVFAIFLYIRGEWKIKIK
ncbi:MFS transporter [Acidianus sulfidivorans JP7]|uniref:MFS transporter n=1 Tax=Acidianus sulfidivorans JP7 TaxID=619593 RepID=A0A2U9IPR9_9CREN|nr:MFS transporter [Acidianus sulfidivorans]AWR98005.1 MFS transporter [Acidianus sulfidivorans JP7]